MNETAGRELDALVAERVMGVAVVRDVNCMYECGFEDHDVGIADSKIEVKDEWVTYFPTPHYSTDIAAAWAVVEKMGEREPGWRFCLLGGDDRGHDPLWWKAEWFGHADPHQNCGQRHGEAYAATAPLAICLAALEAAGCTANRGPPATTHESETER